MTKTQSPRTMLATIDRAAPAPRPLPLHLAIQNLTYASSLAALTGLKNGSIDWKASLRPRARRLLEKLEGVEDAAFRDAVTRELEARINSFADGVARLQAAPRSESLTPLPTFWTEGTTCVARAEAAGAPVLLVPSLVNRARILDLSAERSVVRHLARAGLDTYLIDWRHPGPEETAFTIADYIDRLTRIRDAVADESGQPPVVVGYCMGGLLALALAERDRSKLQKLVLLATPWDFAAMPTTGIRMLRASMPYLRQTVSVFGVMPVDVLQTMFMSLDPGGAARKFRKFARLDPMSSSAGAFVALEDWINDGVPLAGPVALECLQDWYLENKTALGLWSAGGGAIRPETLTIPSLVVVPNADKIVPPASALPLGQELPDAEVLSVPTGHIGMVSGRRAIESVYAPVTAWIAGDGA